MLFVVRFVERNFLVFWFECTIEVIVWCGWGEDVVCHFFEFEYGVRSCVDECCWCGVSSALCWDRGLVDECCCVLCVVGGVEFWGRGDRLIMRCAACCFHLCGGCRCGLFWGLCWVCVDVCVVGGKVGCYLVDRIVGREVGGGFGVEYWEVCFGGCVFEVDVDFIVSVGCCVYEFEFVGFVVGMECWLVVCEGGVCFFFWGVVFDCGWFFWGEEVDCMVVGFVVCFLGGGGVVFELCGGVVLGGVAWVGGGVVGECVECCED